MSLVTIPHDPLNSATGDGKYGTTRMTTGLQKYGWMLTCLLLSLGFPTVVRAQAAPTSQAEASAGDIGQPDPQAAHATVVVQLEILQQLESSKQKRGDIFSLQLAEAVTLPDGTVLPAGIPGRGEVVHAAKAGIGGKPGELILAARTLETPQGTYRLRALHLTGTGKDHAVSALGTSIAAAAAGPAGALLGMVIHGGQVIVPVGARASAKLEPLLQPSAEAPPILPTTPNPPTKESTP